MLCPLNAVGLLTKQLAAGELVYDPKTLEDRLAQISQRAHH